MRLFLKGIVLSLMLASAPALAADANKPLTGNDLETAKEMNDAYARHLYSSTCVERQKAYFLPKGLSNEEASKRLASFKKSCDCLSGEVIKKTSPNDVVDYVTDAYGAQKSTPQSSKMKTKTPKTQQFKQIVQLSRDKDTRKGCGFSQ